MATHYVAHELGALGHDVKQGSARPLPNRSGKATRTTSETPTRSRRLFSGRPLAAFQAAVVAILTPIYEAEFLGFSYGFRPKRSQHQALDALASGSVGGKSTRVQPARASTLGCGTDIETPG